MRYNTRVFVYGFEVKLKPRFTSIQASSYSSLWYQDFDEDGDVIGIFRWKDIAVGAIISVLVFPLNIIIVLLFKKSKVEVR